MKILFLLTQDLESPSGYGRYFPLAKELVKLGHDVTILALHSNYKKLSEKRTNREGVDIYYVSQMHVLKEGKTKKYFSSQELVRKVLLGSFELTRMALNQNADILHICKAHPMNGVAGIIFKYLRKKQVYLDCDDYEAGSGNFKKKWQKRIVEFFENSIPLRVDFITVNTNFMKEKLIRINVPENKIYYLPNGVDKNRFRYPGDESIRSLREKYQLDNKKIVLFVGSLSKPSHPVDLLIHSFAILRKKDPKSHLVIVGGGEEFDNLVNLTQKLELTNSVTFTGKIPPEKISAYYYLADISVDPVLNDESAKGRCPLKLFESWICGVPFVSVDVGDRKFLLGDPPAGLLASTSDPEDLANSLYTVLRDENLSEILRQRGFNRVKNYYWDKIARQLNEIYIGNLKAYQ